MNEEKYNHDFFSYASSLHSCCSKEAADFIRDFDLRIVSAPASEKYHNAFRGGWIKHTMSVFHICKHISSQFYLSDDDMISLKKCALLHDIGKLGTKEQPLYLETIDGFVKNPNMKNSIPHELQSINLIHQYGIPLTDREFKAIVYHGGLYNTPMEEFCKIEDEITLILHTADNLSAKLLERR